MADAKANFSAVVSEAEDGETIELTRHGKAVARLVPATPTPQPSKVDYEEAWASLARLRARLPPRGEGPTAVEIVRSIREE